MKNTIFLIVAAISFSLTVSAQSTVDSIKAKYQLAPMPQPLTVDKAFPALGTYQLIDAKEGQANINITLDSASKGVVWVEGLPQGKFKAFLKKSPSTYRIISQKSNSGKQIPAGTLIYSAETGTLNIALGKEFNEADPAAIFASIPTATAEVKVKTAKTKTKMMFYTATKVTDNSMETNTTEQKDQ